MKRALALMIVLAMVLALCACGTQEKYADIHKRMIGNWRLEKQLPTKITKDRITITYFDETWDFRYELYDNDHIIWETIDGSDSGTSLFEFDGNNELYIHNFGIFPNGVTFYREK